MMNKLKTDIETAIKEYPGLKLEDRGDSFVLNGILDLIDPNSDLLIDSFSVELSYTSSYPYRFPKVVETGGKIERITDRHIYINDNFTLCLAVPIEERLLCRNGITTSWFIKNVLLPRLAEEYNVNNGGKYQREYSHGVNGQWEYYFRKFGTKSSDLVIELLSAILLNNLDKRHIDCPCGSGRKFKKCHSVATNDFNFLPTDIILEQIDVLKKNPHKIFIQ